MRIVECGDAMEFLDSNNFSVVVWLQRKQERKSVEGKMRGEETFSFFRFLETIRDKVRVERERKKRERHLYSTALLNHISFFYRVRC